jgi:hypothetical protein
MFQRRNEMTRDERLNLIRDAVSLARSAGVPAWEIVRTVGEGLLDSGQLREASNLDSFSNQLFPSKWRQAR